MRVLIVLFALMTAACGFAPMYAQPGGQSAIGPVNIGPISGKAGHVLRTELSRLLAVEQNGAAPAQLDIILVETVVPLGIRVDDTATRAEFRLTANYSLTPPNGRVIRGAVSTIADYEIPTAAYAEVAAQDDARERAAEVMAQRFRSELALRMAQAREGGTP